MRKYKNGIKAIENTINNYAVLYIDNPKVRSSIIQQYNNPLISLNPVSMDRFKINIDTNYVKEYIDMLMIIDEVFTYDLVAPRRDREALEKDI